MTYSAHRCLSSRVFHSPRRRKFIVRLIKPPPPGPPFCRQIRAWIAFTDIRLAPLCWAIYPLHTVEFMARREGVDPAGIVAVTTHEPPRFRARVLQHRHEL